MLHCTPARFNRTDQAQARQVKALLRLVEDLGYQVLSSPAGDWTVSACTDPGDSTVVGIDSAQEVVAVARQLAESLQVDRHVVLTQTVA